MYKRQLIGILKTIGIDVCYLRAVKFNQWFLATVAIYKFVARHLYHWAHGTPVSYTHLDVYKRQALYIHKQIKKGMATAVEDQQAIFQQLLKTGTKTVFGKDHSFDQIKTHADFVAKVPIRDYEAFKPYIEKIKEGKHNVLWKGQPIYFAKTSGTTSGVKYIPITKDSIPNHINTARNALLCYMAETGNHAFANGKLIFLSGSPELERVGDCLLYTSRCV